MDEDLIARINEAISGKRSYENWVIVPFEDDLVRHASNTAINSYGLNPVVYYAIIEFAIEQEYYKYEWDKVVVRLASIDENLITFVAVLVLDDGQNIPVVIDIQENYYWEISEPVKMYYVAGRTMVELKLEDVVEQLISKTSQIRFLTLDYVIDLPPNNVIIGNVYKNPNNAVTMTVSVNSVHGLKKLNELIRCGFVELEDVEFMYQRNNSI